MEPVEITAGRLHLRPYVGRDIDAVTAACQDTLIQRWTSVPVPYERRHAEEYVAANSADGWRDGHGRSFAVVDSVSNELLASISLVGWDEATGVGEIGYWTAPHARGRGVATQATLAVARWAFGAVGVERLEWIAEVGNVGSRRVAEKAGFTVEGTLRQRLRLRDGARADAWIGSLLRSDGV